MRVAIILMAITAAAAASQWGFLDRGHRKTPDTASRPLDPSTPVYAGGLATSGSAARRPVTNAIPPSAGCGALRALALVMKRAKEGEAFELEPLLLDAVNSFLLLLAQSVGITVEVTELVKYIAKEIFSFYEAVAVFKIKNPQTTFGTRLCKRKKSPRRRGIRRPVKDDTPDVDLSDIKIVETAV